MASDRPTFADLTLTQEIRGYALDEGMDLVGVAPVGRLADLQPGFRPTEYMPDAKCVVSIVCALADGMCDVWGTYEEEGKTILPLGYYGVGSANWELARVANGVARLIERAGHRSIPFPPHWSVSHYRELTTAPAGWMLPRVNVPIQQDFPHIQAAVAAGLGQIGWNGLLLTPDFGARQRLTSVLTDAPLVNDALYAGPALCQPERCGHACVATCPAGALSSSEIAAVTVAGHTHLVGKLDGVRCQYGLDGLVRGSGGRTRVEIPPGPGDPAVYDAAMALRRPEDTGTHGSQRGLLTGNFCERCLVHCPAHTWRVDR